jgi:hypothetical protein
MGFNVCGHELLSWYRYVIELISDDCSVPAEREQ